MLSITPTSSIKKYIYRTLINYTNKNQILSPLPSLSQFIASSPFSLPSSLPVATSAHTWTAAWLTTIQPNPTHKAGFHPSENQDSPFGRISARDVRTSLKCFHWMSRIRNNEELPHFFHILSYSWLSFTRGPRGENLIECVIGMGIYKALNILCHYSYFRKAWECLSFTHNLISCTSLGSQRKITLKQSHGVERTWGHCATEGWHVTVSAWMWHSLKDVFFTSVKIRC